MVDREFDNLVVDRVLDNLHNLVAVDNTAGKNLVVAADNMADRKLIAL